ncbi:MAG TPA: hypothetical protein EYP17_08755 [Candidatus Latescibacteria bacterium]|nr:hypothetical protein [Candidatus Latescibacterota bacterium]
MDLLVVLLEDMPVPNFILGPATGCGKLWLEKEDLHTEDGVEISSRSGVIAFVRSFPHAVGSVAHELGHWLGLPDLADLSAVREEDPSGSQDEELRKRVDVECADVGILILVIPLGSRQIPCIGVTIWTSGRTTRGTGNPMGEHGGWYGPFRRGSFHRIYL